MNKYEEVLLKIMATRCKGFRYNGVTMISTDGNCTVVMGDWGGFYGIYKIEYITGYFSELSFCDYGINVHYYRNKKNGHGFYEECDKFEIIKMFSEIYKQHMLKRAFSKMVENE